MDFYGFFLNNMALAGQGLLQLLFVSRFTKRRAGFFCSVLWLMVFWMGETTASLLQVDFVDIGMDFLLLWALGRFFLQNSGLIAGIAALLAELTILFSFGIVDSFISLLFPYLARRPWFYALPPLAVYLSLLLGFFCSQGILTHFPLAFSKKGELLRGPRTLFPSGLFCLGAEAYLLCFYYQEASLDVGLGAVGRNLGLFLFQTLGLCALFGLCRHAYEGLEVQEALVLARREANLQRDYAAQAYLCYAGTRSFRHDFKNHLAVLDGLVASGDMERAKDYLGGLLESAKGLSFPAYTGNRVADFLLSEKLGQAMASGALVEASLSLPEPCPIEDLDLCTILANALDNAVAALSKLPCPKHLCVSGERQGDFLLLRFENTCADGPVPSMGTGLSNIKEAVGRYRGAMDYGKSDGNFVLKLLLDISLPPGSRS